MRISDWSSDVCSSDLQIGPEVVENLVERGGHRRQRRQMFDQPVATIDGVAGLDRLPILVGDGPGGEIAFAVGERLIALHREAVLKVGQHILYRKSVV